MHDYDAECVWDYEVSCHDYLEEDYNEDDYSCGLKIIETFAEYAERNTTTDMIATTEY